MCQSIQDCLWFSINATLPPSIASSSMPPPSPASPLPASPWKSAQKSLGGWYFYLCLYFVIGIVIISGCIKSIEVRAVKVGLVALSLHHGHQWKCLCCWPRWLRLHQELKDKIDIWKMKQKIRSHKKKIFTKKSIFQSLFKLYCGPEKDQCCCF